MYAFGLSLFSTSASVFSLINPSVTVSVNEKKFIESALLSELRVDGRRPFDYRKLYIIFGRDAHGVMMAKEMSIKAEEKNINDGEEAEGSVKTSISMRSFPPVSASSEDVPAVAYNMDGIRNKTEQPWRLVLKGDKIEMSANALGLTMESNGIRILEPFDTSVKFSNASGKTNIHVAVSDIFMNFSFSTLQLFLTVEEDILKFLRMTSRKITVSCSEFDKLGTFQSAHNNQTYAFWRPHAPPGFAILGDYMTATDKPPSKGVLAVNTRYVKIKKPEAFKLVWPPSDSQGAGNLELVPEDGEESCSIWFPVAPKGYVALGCVVSPGKTQPSLSSAFCIHASLVHSLIGGFCASPVNFHAKDGSGYKFLGDHVLQLDKLNPQVASRMVSAFSRWKRYDDTRQNLAKAGVKKLADVHFSLI
ncbi:unnamed protein product [Lactuca virosa]|uniref:Peptidase M1 alanyl aminopeptidase C-terminal domain-containing protein n=1 Tax=Lactuca virosa TaxID=75947 RepID=A0AAU9M3B5_9ASTR|nr:unnamed protein product [Lactuca virosa]